jgi:hypothetical protein
VVDGSNAAIRIRNRKSLFAQHLEGLWARYFVDEMEADEKLRLAGWKLSHRVGRPDFVEKSLSHEDSVTSGPVTADPE